MDTTVRGRLATQTAPRIDALEAAAEPVEPEQLERVRILRDHLEDGTRSPLVYAVAGDHYRGLKG